MSSTNRLIGWKRDDPHWRAKFCESVRELVAEVSILEENLQKVHTPFTLCEQILDRLDQEASLKGCERIAVLFNLEFVHCLIERGINPRRIWFFADASLKEKRAKEWYNVNVLSVSYDSTKKNGERINIMPKPRKQFDVVIMNPPYQSQSKSRDGRSGVRGAAMWDKFVLWAFDAANGRGYVCAIHPSGWRESIGSFHEVKELLEKKQVNYLELHDRADGVKTFGAQTSYDWYVAQNCDPCRETVVRDLLGHECLIDISTLPFIPNSNIVRISKLMAKDGEETVNLMHSESAYEGRKDWVSRTKNKKFKHPCIYTITASDVNLWWSSKTTNGHFGVPKVIFTNGSSGTLVDRMGEYGLSQFAYAIVDSPKNLSKIQTAITSAAFLEIMDDCSILGKHRYNRKAISCFRKDFWKEFV